MVESRFPQFSTIADDWGDAFGNFNYGATGAALGLSSETLLRAAGAVQVLSDLKNFVPKTGEGSPLGGAPYGDQLDDSWNIQAGIRYYQNHCNNKKTN